VRYQSGSISLVDSGVSSFTLANGGTTVYELRTNGDQGQRPLNRCSSKDFDQVVFVPTTTSTFHDETGAVGMLLQE
jgi:hypothetical protein